MCISKGTIANMNNARNENQCPLFPASIDPSACMSSTVSDDLGMVDIMNRSCQDDTGPQNFEPTPIDQEIPVKAVHSVNSLPVKMKNYCEEYIAALSHLFPEAPLGSSTIPQLQHVSLSNSSSEVSLISQRSDNCNMTKTHDLGARIHPYQHERWNERYQDLVQYYQEHQNCNVPYVYKINPCLGQWVKRQRHQYKLFKQGLHSNLNDERIQALNMLGFIWDSHGAAWEEKYEELQEFHRLHGNANVPCSYNGSSKLSTWIKRQRRQYRLFMSNQPSTMDFSRISRLESLGLVWDYYGKGKSPNSFHVPIFSSAALTPGSYTSLNKN